MFDKLIENQGKTLVKIAMDKYITDDDKCLLAWKNDKGEPEFKVFKVDLRSYIKDLEVNSVKVTL